jgi:tetratricopeptide (TPR) repeat protein
LDKLLTRRIQKAGVVTCLFLCTGLTYAQQTGSWLSQPAEQAVYRQLLNLEVSKARRVIANQNTPVALYLASLSEALELLISENESLFYTYEIAFKKRLQLLSKAYPKSPQALHATAELRLHWALVYLKFGHDFDAAWNIRQSFVLTQDCLHAYPQFIAAQKTAGLLNILLGSVPDKYQWVLSVLAMRGSVEEGIRQLKALQFSDNTVLATEASLMLYLAQGLLLQQPQHALAELSVWPQEKHTRLSLFLAAVLAIKNSESEKALTYLQTLNSMPGEISLAYANYLKGEVYLHKGDYPAAIASYQDFLTLYSGNNFSKDAYYKIALCYWLLNNKQKADEVAEKARLTGREYTEADRHAAKSLAEREFPNPILLKIRYATDGGYYETALRIIESVKTEHFTKLKDQTEFTYRKARLYHKLNQLETGKSLYLKTISLSGNNPWYFAPNACLQLGYLLMEDGEKEQAAFYFRQALSYKKHDYKNSIDSKARSALSRLNKTN